MDGLTLYDVYAAMAVSVIVGGVYGWLISRYGHAVWDVMGPGVGIIGFVLGVITTAAGYGLIIVLAH